jgi:cytosine/creatinine deaminase
MPLLDRFPRLRERREQRAGSLSGGEQQMLAIARGLMGRPRMLMLDEPSLGLAPKLLDDLYGLLAELRDEGTTILLVDQMAALVLWLPTAPMCRAAPSRARGAPLKSRRTRRWRMLTSASTSLPKKWKSIMDTVVKNARLPGQTAPVDIAISGGRIAAIEPNVAASGTVIEAGGRLVSPGFVETHIHLDKSCILDRCTSTRGDLEEAIGEVTKAKAAFTPEDVRSRAIRTLEKAILQGTTHMRTHLEVDPGVGLRGLEGVMPLVKEYAWAIDLQICVFPQEGLLNNPGTDELMIEALKRGCGAVGAAPYTDSDPHGQIDRVFEMAREFDVDIDMHLDFGPNADNMTFNHVCRRTEEYKYGGRVAIGHVTQATSLPIAGFEAMAKRLADAGVALTVLPSTDLFLMGRHDTHDHNVTRGVVPAHKLLHHGVNCSLSSNNVLNPFTPFGDCSLIRMANLYANICQVGKKTDMQECFNMVTRRPAAMMRLADYGLTVGRAANFVVLDATEPEMAVAEIVPVLHAFKRGRMTVSRNPAKLIRPQ